MKLSEVKGDQAIEVMARVIGPVASLAADKDFMAIFKPSGTEDGLSPQESALERLKTAIPTMLDKHKADFVELMAAVNLVSAEEYTAGLTFPKLLHDVVELMTDESLLAFFA